MPNVTIIDVAERAGVSRSTVSRVLSSSPRVSATVRAAVQRAASELSYRPSIIAQSLARGVFPSIQIIMADIRNPVYAEMARGIQDTAQSYGFMADFGNTDDIPEREVGYVEAARGQRFAGIILISTSGGKELKKALLHLTCPVVLMNRLVKGFPCDTVLLDNESGGAMAAQQLLALGHRKIFHLAGLRRSSASMGRMEGFRRALKSAGVELPADAVEYGNYRVEFGEALGNRLVEAGLPYTAVFAANDLMAIGLLVTFATLGVRVPDDISVIGFDDMAFAKLSGVGLTTIRQPQYEMGAAAAKMLFERIQERDRPFRSTVFAPALIERKSCGPPRSREPAAREHVLTVGPG